MAFKGMNPEEGNEVATAVTESAQTIMEIVGDMTSVVNGVEWVGPDYDSFKEDWGTFIGNQLEQLVSGLQEKGKSLSAHAEAQTETSNNG